MTAEKVKKWIVAMLSANAGVIANFSAGADAVLSAGQDIPSDVGVYIKIADSVPSQTRPFDDVEVLVLVVQTGEQECFDAMDDIANAFDGPEGIRARSGTTPLSVGLSVKHVTRPKIVDPPAEIGNDGTFGAAMSFMVSGRDRSSPT